MKLTGLHLLLTYQCTFECDHCFVWGSPFQSGTMTLKNIRRILDEAQDLGTVEWIYFEGGEPTMYYPILLRAAQIAHEMGFKVGVVSNAYWATDPEDAEEWLRPLSGIVEDYSVSSDLFHYDEKLSQQAKTAAEVAESLGIPVGYISVASPEEGEAGAVQGQLPLGDSQVMYRGRAAAKLTDRATHKPWRLFIECPYEDLRDPGRVHVDPLGNLHICQGISIGNIYRESLRQICKSYDPDAYPITGALLAGGPVELVQRYGLEHQEAYADACHLCDEARRGLRSRFPEVLTPDQVYGEYL